LEHHSTGKRSVSYDPPQRRQRTHIPSIMRRVTRGVVVVWLALVASLGVWIAQRLTAQELVNLSAGAEYEAQITGRVVDRLFTEMASVANMVARQSEVIQLAADTAMTHPASRHLRVRSALRISPVTRWRAAWVISWIDWPAISTMPVST